MRLAVLALTLAVVSPARAQDAPDAPSGEAADAPGLAVPDPSPAAAPAPEEALPDDGLTRWGLFADAGLPEGGTVSLVYRPVSAVRLHAGPAWSVIAFGVQGGLTLVPWHLGLSPLVSVEAGRFFAADASFLARESSGVPEEIEPLLRDVSYDYAAVHVGLELGSRNGLAFSLRAGLAYVSLTARGSTTVTDGGGSGAVVTFVDPRVRGTFPSVKLGVQYWF